MVLIGRSYLSLILVVGTVHWIDGRKNGAPIEACGSMTPGHDGTSPKAADSVLHELKVAKGSQSGTFLVTLDSMDNVPFKGFFIQGKASGADDPIGTWNISNLSGLAKTANCAGRAASAVTHVDSQPKTSVTFPWSPPPKYSGSVIFQATVVQDFNNYWEGIPSQELHLLAGISQKGVLEDAQEGDPKAMAVNMDQSPSTSTQPAIQPLGPEPDIQPLGSAQQVSNQTGTNDSSPMLSSGSKLDHFSNGWLCISYLFTLYSMVLE